MSKFPSYYILVGRTPIAVDVETWARAFEDRHKSEKDPWRIGRDDINEHCEVSTVFLGLDHQWDEGEPILFETMIFGGPLNDEIWRYSTYAQAERGHAEAVVQARKAAAQVKAIYDTAVKDGQK